MAHEDCISAAPSSAHPMAGQGYGKRTVCDGASPKGDGFAHLSLRGRYLAGFVDALPEQAAMDVKTLAKEQPLFGQMAVGGALRELSAAGHLRRVRCRAATGDGTVRWVSLTYWSRVARSDQWWARFLADDAPGPDPDPVPVPALAPVPAPVSEPEADLEPDPESAPSAGPALGPALGPAPGRAAGPEPVPVPVPVSVPVPVQRRVTDGASDPQRLRHIPKPSAGPGAPRSEAYEALAQLGWREPRLMFVGCGLRVS